MVFVQEELPSVFLEGSFALDHCINLNSAGQASDTSSNAING
jgi:hypothetical protein